jgi:hypothetical protein
VVRLPFRVAEEEMEQRFRGSAFETMRGAVDECVCSR